MILITFFGYSVLKPTCSIDKANIMKKKIFIAELYRHCIGIRHKNTIKKHKHYLCNNRTFYVLETTILNKLLICI